jgi:hypothetical protein
MRESAGGLRLVAGDGDDLRRIALTGHGNDVDESVFAVIGPGIAGEAATVAYAPLAIKGRNARTRITQASDA